MGPIKILIAAHFLHDVIKILKCTYIFSFKFIAIHRWKNKIDMSLFYFLGELLRETQRVHKNQK